MAGAVVLTFDNLGEAADLERGVWPKDAPLGRHSSVTEVLPKLLDELERCGLQATFCVEGLNCALYPEALTDIAARGHTLGVHGWRHEAWEELSADPERERELLARADAAFRELGLTVAGFRPPGGGVTPRTERLVSELGYEWWSLPASDPPPPPGPRRLVDVTYEWAMVDAYGLMESFGALRSRFGDPAAPLDAAQLGDRFARRLRGSTGVEVVILHPFLMLDPAWFDEVRGLLELLGSRERAAPGTVLDAETFSRCGPK